jgi:hypothetical protein
MKTDELIERLAREAQPVTRLPRPGVRTAVWLLGGAAYLAVVVLLVLTGRSRGPVATDGLYLVQVGASVATGIAAAVAAFASVVPGAGRRARSLVVACGLVAMGTLAWGCLLDLRASGTFGAASQTDWPCVVSMTLGGGALWALMAVMLKKGAPLAPRTTALFAGVAALSLANVEACVTRPHPFASIVLLWHGTTILLLVAIFTGIGDRVLHWPTRSVNARPERP